MTGRIRDRHTSTGVKNLSRLFSLEHNSWKFVDKFLQVTSSYGLSLIPSTIIELERQAAPTKATNTTKHQSSSAWPKFSIRHYAERAIKPFAATVGCHQ